MLLNLIKNQKKLLVMEKTTGNKGEWHLVFLMEIQEKNEKKALKQKKRKKKVSINLLASRKKEAKKRAREEMIKINEMNQTDLLIYDNKITEQSSVRFKNFKIIYTENLENTVDDLIL